MPIEGISTKGPSIPYPGDGVCPTVSQFNEAVISGHDSWRSSVSEARQEVKTLYVADHLMDLLERIPPLFAPSTEAFLIVDTPNPQAKYALEWITTTHSTCTQPVKHTYHFLTLGVSELITYEFQETAETHLHFWPGIEEGHLKHFSRLIFAWTYILSCRWIEILKNAGEEVYLQQTEEINDMNFWKVVAERPWQATIIRGGNVFYAPWCLTEHNAPSQNCHSFQVSPDSSSAFDTFVGLCIREGLTKECIAATLAVAIILPNHGHSTLKLPPFTTPMALDPARGLRDDYYEKLRGCLSRCLTLCCCFEGIDALLCSVFFEPHVPCNLIGAHLSGVADAIGQVTSNTTTFAQLMVKRNPKLSPLWLAAIWSGQASNVLSLALRNSSPISLPIASWTDIPQSFLQIEYHPVANGADFIPRAREYTVIYLTKCDAGMPFTHSPPFGETAISNTSLEVQEHLPHDHRPIKSRTNWILKSGVWLPTLSSDITHFSARLPSIARSACVHGCNKEDDLANGTSGDATFNLFYWYKHNEGGLWLAEGQENDQDVRRIQSHPWITYDSDEEVVSESRKSNLEIDEDRIKRWQKQLTEDTDNLKDAEEIY